MKERMKARADKMKETAFCNMSDTDIKPSALPDEEIVKIFSTGEKVEKTPRGAKPPIHPSKQGKKNKK